MLCCTRISSNGSYAPENVIRYLVARMERSFAAARDVVVRMDRLSLANRSQITLSLARSVMEPGQGDLWRRNCRNRCLGAGLQVN